MLFRCLSFIEYCYTDHSNGKILWKIKILIFFSFNADGTLMHQSIVTCCARDDRKLLGTWKEDEARLKDIS